MIPHLIIALSIALQPTTPPGGTSGPTESQLDEAAARVERLNKASMAIKPLVEEFTILQESLQAMQGFSPDERPLIAALREKVAAFNTQWPDSVAGLAMDLTLCTWLKDSQRVDELYARLTVLRPEDAALRISWAKFLRNQNRTARVQQVIEEGKLDPARYPEVIRWLADCQLAEHRFDEALKTLQTIPDSALDPKRDPKDYGSPYNPKTDPTLGEQIKKLREALPEYPSYWHAEEALRQSEAAADDLPRVELQTSKGRIVLELFENQAPNTVANFISLVESGFYNTPKFHRVLPFQLVQSGDPNTKPGGVGIGGFGGPGYDIPDEFARDDHRYHFTGSLSMYSAGRPNSGGSQFNITLAPTPWLNGVQTVFGRVIEGMDIVRAIEINDDLVSAKVLRKREHEYVVNKYTPPPATPGTPGSAPADTTPGTTITIPATPTTPPPAPPPATPAPSAP